MHLNSEIEPWPLGDRLHGVGGRLGDSWKAGERQEAIDRRQLRDEVLSPGTANEGNLGGREATMDGAQRGRRTEQVAQIERLEDRDSRRILGQVRPGLAM